MRFMLPEHPGTFQKAFLRPRASDSPQPSGGTFLTLIVPSRCGFSGRTLKSTLIIRAPKSELCGGQKGVIEGEVKRGKGVREGTGPDGKRGGKNEGKREGENEAESALEKV